MKTKLDLLIEAADAALREYYTVGFFTTKEEPMMRALRIAWWAYHQEQVSKTLGIPDEPKT